MSNQHSGATFRKGQFLWMEPAARKAYLQTLKKRISEGYYYTDRIFSKIADELAPVLDEAVTSR
ncbi:MAG: hypothetical protein JXA18_13470 [Chitinispirillaceae bacterium]|nr:hypothetical protein [Chitinispirillaceae bacterium]